MDRQPRRTLKGNDSITLPVRPFGYPVCRMKSTRAEAPALDPTVAAPFGNGWIFLWNGQFTRACRSDYERSSKIDAFAPITALTSSRYVFAHFHHGHDSIRADNSTVLRRGKAVKLRYCPAT